MLVVETIAKIRRAHFIQGKSIQQICRELRVSRNTVRKVVRSGATEFSYDWSMQPRPKIDPWRSKLEEMLAGNARQPKRQRRTLVRIYEELRNQGYDGSYDAARRFAASWSQATWEASVAAYVPLAEGARRHDATVASAIRGSVRRFGLAAGGCAAGAGTDCGRMTHQADFSVVLLGFCLRLG